MKLTVKQWLFQTGFLKQFGIWRWSTKHIVLPQTHTIGWARAGVVRQTVMLKQSKVLIITQSRSSYIFRGISLQMASYILIRESSLTEKKNFSFKCSWEYYTFIGHWKHIQQKYLINKHATEWQEFRLCRNLWTQIPCGQDKRSSFNCVYSLKLVQSRLRGHWLH